jgi:DNA-binding HxlR family transcriptional regulator
MEPQFSINDRSFYCPVELTFSVISGKYKGMIIWHLKNGAVRYGEMRRLLKGVTHKMLTQSLRELEHDGIVHREAYHSIPPKVEYSLTERGEEMLTVINQMGKWGMNFKIQEPELNT